MNAGVKKIGEIIEGTAADGTRIKERFLKSIPALARLKAEEKRIARKGVFKGLDGRLLPIKSDHYVMAARLQGGEVSVMKLAHSLWWKKLKKMGVWFGQALDVHDEWQLECYKKDAELIGRVQVEAIKKAGVLLKLHCPLDGESKIGESWAHTH